MNQNKPSDHWANLAAELGAEPASEPSPEEPGKQADGPAAPLPSPDAVNTPPVEVASEYQQQAVSASSSASASEPESPASTADTIPAVRSEPASGPTTAPAQTKSSWDILAEQLGIASEQMAEAQRTDVGGSGRLADSPGQAGERGVVAPRAAGVHRPAGGRVRRQQTPTRFGEGIFDEGPPADVIQPTQDAPEPDEQSVPTDLPQAATDSAVAQAADLAGRQHVAQQPTELPPAERLAERKAGRRRRKKRRGQEGVTTTKPSAALDRPAENAVCRESEAMSTQPEPGQEWREHVEADEQWHETTSVEQLAAIQPTEQLAAAEDETGVEAPAAYCPIADQQEFVQPSEASEASEEAESDTPEPADSGGQAAADATSARSESAKHRAIPTWVEAISVIINANLEARARRGETGRDRRDRGGR